MQLSRQQRRAKARAERRQGGAEIDAYCAHARNLFLAARSRFYGTRSFRSVARPIAGRVIVVGAGPSAADVLPSLPELARSALVFTTNTAGRMVSQRVCPDLLLIQEFIDVTAHIEGARAALVAIQPTAGPDVWRAALSVGPVVHKYDAVNGGPAACEAARLALTFGATEIVLAGFDLGPVGDVVYAAESAHGDVRDLATWRDASSVVRDVDRSLTSPLARGPRAEVYTAPETVAPGVTVPAMWAYQYGLLSQLARDCAARGVRAVNVSRGVDLPGWVRSPISALASMPSPRRPWFDLEAGHYADETKCAALADRLASVEYARTFVRHATSPADHEIAVRRVRAQIVGP